MFVRVCKGHTSPSLDVQPPLDIAGSSICLGHLLL